MMTLMPVAAFAAPINMTADAETSSFVAEDGEPYLSVMRVQLQAAQLTFMHTSPQQDQLITYP